MSDCCCSSCCCQPTNGVGTPPPTPTPTPSHCTQYQVTIRSIDVSQIDDGFLGGNLETSWTFVVNGQAKPYVNNDLGVGVTNIGISFIVNVPTDASTITIQVSAIEHDPASDDTIAGFTQVWAQAQNWGLGAQSGSASDSNITYTLNYDIACAQKSTFVVGSEILLAYGLERAKTRNGVKEEGVTPDILVNWSIDRLRREGWALTTISGDSFVFSGSGTFLPLLVKMFQKPPQRKK
jgi:hypothetical protein